MQRKQFYYQTGGSNNPLGSFGSIALLVLFFIALFFIARFVFNILWWVSPLLLIATLVIDYKVITGFISWVFNTLKRNPIFGIGMLLLTFFGFPIVVGFLFGKAVLKQKIKKAQDAYETRTKGELIDFEEVESRPIDPIELPEPPQKPKQEAPNRYDDLFE